MRRSIAVLVTLVLLAVGLSAPVAADQPHHPGGPCIQSDQHVSLESIYYYDDVVRELDRIERTSRGLVTVDSAGQSGEGHELFYATVGHGPTVFWIQGRIHGNERLGTQAALRVLDYLASGAPDARLIREQLTVVVIPMYNPDGAERNIRGSGLPAPSIDLNRDWENFAKIESVNWWKLYAEVRPNYALDYHHVGHAHVAQGTDDLVQFQIGTRPIAISRFTEDQWRTQREMSMLVHDSVAHIGAVNVSRYPLIDITNAVISRMIMGGTAPAGEQPIDHRVDGALFFEYRNVGQKSSGMLVRLHTVPTMALLTAVADGSLSGYDISGFGDLPAPQARACGT